MHSSPIRSPPPPSPVCMTTNRIKPSPATGTASRQSKRHRPGSRNRSHHLSCRVGTSSPTEQNAAARRRPLSPFQEVPVRALHIPRSARAVAASPSALGEIPMPRAFRFAASGRFPWSVERSRVVVESSGHTFMEPAFIMFWSCSLPSRGRRRPVSPWI